MLGSRTIREGSVGLLIIFGLLVFGGLFFWLNNIRFGKTSYEVIVKFPDAYGLKVGNKVRYRGVEVGEITNLEPSANFIDVKIEITPADLSIPRNTKITTNRSGFIGETFVDIIPRQNLSDEAVAASPIAKDCKSNQEIVCDGDTLIGNSGVSFEQLLPSTLRLTELYSSPEFYDNLNSAIANFSTTATEISKLSDELRRLSTTVTRELENFSVKTDVLVVSANETAGKISKLATDLDDLVVRNRETISNTLTSFNNTSDRLNDLIVNLNPAVEKLTVGLQATDTKQLFQNLEILTANGAETFTNLRTFTGAFSDPNNIVLLQETLDSARVTFANTQKLTSDLDELIGDPEFRKNLRRLVDGLENLVSYTDKLDREIAAARRIKIEENYYSKAAKAKLDFHSEPIKQNSKLRKLVK